MFFCFKQKTAYELRCSDWSSDVCSSDLVVEHGHAQPPGSGTDQVCHLDGDAHTVAEGRSGSEPGTPPGVARDGEHGAHDQHHDRERGGELNRRGGRATGPADRKSTRLHSRHSCAHRMASSDSKKKNTTHT